MKRFFNLEVLKELEGILALFFFWLFIWILLYLVHIIFSTDTLVLNFLFGIWFSVFFFCIIVTVFRLVILFFQKSLKDRWRK